MIKLIKFRKLANLKFQNLTICKIMKIPKMSNFINYYILIVVNF